MKEELLVQLKALLEDSSADFKETIKTVNSIKRKYEEILEDEKFNNIKNEVDVDESSTDKAFQELILDFEKKKNAFFQALDNEKNEALQAKQKIVEELQILSEKPEEVTSFKKLRDFQESWKKISYSNDELYKEVQAQYNYLIEKLYHDLQLNREFRELDFKKNLQAKKEIIAKVENLENDETVTHVAQVLKHLEFEWKETGPVPFELKDEINGAYLAAIKKTYARIDHFFVEKRQKDKDNLILKEKIASKVQSINLKNTLTTHKAWTAETDFVMQLRNDWKNLGYSEHDEKVWELFKAECSKFFENKNEFYKNIEKQRKLSREQKTILCEKAEAILKEFEENKDFNKISQQLIALQKQWNKIPPAPQLVENALWNRFRNVCDTFFNSKKEVFAKEKEQETINLELKKELLQEIQQYQLTNETDKDLEQLKSFAQKWQAIGFVPRAEAKNIIQEYNKLLDELYGKLRTNRADASKMRYQARIESLKSADGGKDLLRNERSTIRRKIEHLKNEVQTLENNLGFFKGNATSPMAKQVLDKIQKNNNDIEALYAQLEIIENSR
jgi:hypothetical protein